MNARWKLVPLAVLLVTLSWTATADVEILSCNDDASLRSRGIYWECQNFGKVLAKENTTFYLSVEPQSAAYQQFDINITLTSINGDADL